MKSPIVHVWSLGLLFAVTLIPGGEAQAAAVLLGTAGSFAVLSGAGITNTGPTVITGDTGTFPNTAMTGFGSVVITGTHHGGDAVAQNAKLDLITAYNDAAGRSAFVEYAGGFDLVGLTLIPGVYSDSSSLFLTGTVTLDAQGDPNAVWIIQTGSTLITGSDSRVSLLNGASACNVFWQVGSSATLGTDTDFAGTILALTSITLNTGASVNGRVLARNGAVTMDTNVITLSGCAIPEPDGSLFLMSGLAALTGRRRGKAPSFSPAG